MTRQEYLAWEQASRDSIDVKRCYIDMAGDLVAGVLLSQILYWHLPGVTGAEKLRVEKDGERWLVKGRADWWGECRITPKQFDRAADVLEAKGLIVTDIKRFNGSPTKHIRIVWENFLRDLSLIAMTVSGGKNDVPQRSITTLPKGEQQASPKVKMDVDQTSRFLTETPSENTKEKIKEKIGDAAAPPEVLAPLSRSRKGPEQVGPKKKSWAFSEERWAREDSHFARDLCRKKGWTWRGPGGG